MVTRPLLTRVGLGLSIAITWLIVLVRIQPWPFSDYAVFLSVARRLNAGDVLYEGIWDNKDPFVYYSIALFQPLGQPALWVLEASWFVLASVAVYAIGRSYLLSRHWSLFIGAVLTPIVLIPFHYFPGTTHLPGVALTLAFIALITARKPAIAGLTLGLLAFFKLSMLPIAVIALVILVLKRKSYRSLLPLTGGFFVVLASGLAVLAMRHELQPYFGSLAHNFTYSQTNTDTGNTGPLAVFSERADVLLDIHVLVTVVTVALILAVTFPLRRSVEIWDLTAATFLTASLTLIAIGKFPHHAQVLGVSAALSLITLIMSFPQLRSARPLLSAGVALIIAIALTGFPSIKGYRDALLNPQGTWAAMTTTDPATADLLASGPPRTFAIVQGGGLPRSPGLEDWDLVCRHTAQRPWESAELLQESLDCFPNAEVILIGKDFAPAAGPPAFADFTEEVAELLDEEYKCAEGQRSVVCTRQSIN